MPRRHHVYTFGILLGAVALMVSGLNTWQEALTPKFIGGFLFAAGAVLKAMYQDSPNDPPAIERLHDAGP